MKPKFFRRTSSTLIQACAYVAFSHPGRLFCFWSSLQRTVETTTSTHLPQTIFVLCGLHWWGIRTTATWTTATSVAVVLGGSCPGGSYPGGDCPRWQLS